jgi:hypothetical protein
MKGGIDKMGGTRREGVVAAISEALKTVSSC